MTVAAFDTLAYARRLKEAGAGEAQAEAHAEAVRDAVTECVAAKADLCATVADLKAEIAASERRMMLAMVALAGLIVALVKLLPA